MIYGKLINGIFEPFKGGYIRYNGRVYTNPTETTLIELGYKPLIEADYPEYKEGYYIETVYTESDTEILQSHEYREIKTEEFTETEVTS